MTPTLRLPLLPMLATLLLTGIPCRAQLPEASPTGLHTISLNLAPAVNREVQLSYERALFKTSSLEITTGTRIPAARDKVVRSIGPFWPRSYEDRVFTLPWVATSCGVPRRRNPPSPA